MPIIKTHTIRTMRDIWDEERRAAAAKPKRESAVFSRSRVAVGEQAEEGLAKVKKYFFEHLELKEVAMDFFPEYEKYLGEGGFTKV